MKTLVNVDVAVVVAAASSAKVVVVVDVVHQAWEEAS